MYATYMWIYDIIHPKNYADQADIGKKHGIYVMTGGYADGAEVLNVLLHTLLKANGVPQVGIPQASEHVLPRSSFRQLQCNRCGQVHQCPAEGGPLRMSADALVSAWQQY